MYKLYCFHQPNKLKHSTETLEKQKKINKIVNVSCYQLFT